MFSAWTNDAILSTLIDARMVEYSMMIERWLSESLQTQSIFSVRR